MSVLEDKLVKVLLEEGVVDEHSLRNHRIKRRYNQLLTLKNEDGKRNLSCKEARGIVAEEFFLGENAIQKILYMKKK